MRTFFITILSSRRINIIYYIRMLTIKYPAGACSLQTQISHSDVVGVREETLVILAPILSPQNHNLDQLNP